ncbi:hypothetical protein BDZ45DRAFT_751864 [Acephala macrosclerotiorum]|nr:hypothetical protein BDZ45DRAFT_751864 [Acephala macrosclerotiorum]
MPSITRGAFGALLLSALAAGSPVPEPQFASGTPCEEMPPGKYVCADNWNWINICGPQGVFVNVAECNGRTCQYASNGVPYCWSALSRETVVRFGDHFRMGLFAHIIEICIWYIHIFGLLAWLDFDIGNES